MKQRPFRSSLIAVAVTGVLAMTVATSASAQFAAERAAERRAEREARKQEKAGKRESQYADATRKEPDAKASGKMSSRLKKMLDLYERDKPEEARAIADEIVGNSAANEYDKAFAAQLAANIAYEADDMAAAMDYLRKAIEFNGLDNDGHFNSMLMLAQLQMQEDQYAEALATLDRFLSESGTQKAEHLVLKGNALYRLERYPEAAAVLKQAIDASPEPRADWQQLLMATYIETGQTQEAARLAEGIAQKNPNDKRAQMNLVATYLQSDMMDKAAETLEKMRAAGQLTEDKDYRQLYATYLNMDGKESEAINVINEGIQKGVLKPDYQTYVALAQAYYFTDQAAPAIDAYKKAAPLAPDGETYLNLARLLWQEDRIPEAKEAARQAVAKGIKKPDDAKKILALPGGK